MDQRPRARRATGRRRLCAGAWQGGALTPAALVIGRQPQHLLQQRPEGWQVWQAPQPWEEGRRPPFDGLSTSHEHHQRARPAGQAVESRQTSGVSFCVRCCSGGGGAVGHWQRRQHLGGLDTRAAPLTAAATAGQRWCRPSAAAVAGEAVQVARRCCCCTGSAQATIPAPPDSPGVRPAARPPGGCGSGRWVLTSSQPGYQGSQRCHSEELPVFML